MSKRLGLVPVCSFVATPELLFSLSLLGVVNAPFSSTVPTALGFFKYSRVLLFLFLYRQNLLACFLPQNEVD